MHDVGGVLLKSYYELIRHEGNRDLFRAAEMSILALTNGYPLHIHAQGLRGTGKTSIMRAVKDILPPIVRIKNCIYNCHPAAPHCPEHRNLSSEIIAAIGTETVPTPFLEISHSAKIGTVVGSIDLTRLTDKQAAVAALLPGTIPKAHRGIIFIDEINRLADTSPEIADVLLDLMGTKPGRIQVEETGLPTVDLPVNVTVWAASNPDEDPGPLVQIRKQLSDRFDLTINMERPSDHETVLAILDKSSQKLLNHETKPLRISGRLSDITSDYEVKNILASIYVDFGLESLRAVEGMEIAACLSALIAGRTKITIEDIVATIPLVLGHRTDNATITGILKYLEGLSAVETSKNIIQTTATNKEIQQHNIEGEIKDTLSWCNRLWDSFKKIWKINRYDAKSLISPSLSDISRNTGSATSVFEKKSHELSLDADSSSCSMQFNSNITKKQCGNQVGSCQNNLTDPACITIKAPPKQATPLAKLPIEEFVASEDNK